MSSVLESPRDALAPLSAEEEAALDADPLQRLYDMNALTAPTALAPTLGALTKLLLLQGLGGGGSASGSASAAAAAEEDEEEESSGTADGTADYAVEFFEQLKLARAADPRIDYESFLAAQAKILQRKLEAAKKVTYDFEKEFDPPEQLTKMLVAFSREVIRFQPAGDAGLLGFALEYFTCVGAAEDGSAEPFLRRQAALADEKQRLWDVEKKRSQRAKEKKQVAKDAEDDE